MLITRSENMPIVSISMKKGHTDQYKKTFLNSVHISLMETLQIPDEDRFQRIIEFDPNFFDTAPDKSEDFCVIEITMFPGRTKEQKKLVIEGITRKLQDVLGIQSEDVFIIIYDPELENWGMRGQQLGN